MRIVVTIACLVGALAAFAMAVSTHLEVSMSGFPDGYVTDFGKAVEGPLDVVSWVAGGLGVVLVGLAFGPLGTRVRTVGLLVAVVAVMATVVVGEVAVPWYFGVRLGLDDGVGG